MPGGIGSQPRSLVLEFLKNHDGEAASREIGQELGQKGYSYPPSRVLRVLEDEGLVERGDNGYLLTQEGWDHEEQNGRSQGDRGHQGGRSDNQGRSQGQEGGNRSQGQGRNRDEGEEQGLARCRQLIDRLLEINTEEKEVALELDQELDNLSEFEEVMPMLQKLIQKKRGRQNQGSRGRQREAANA